MERLPRKERERQRREREFLEAAEKVFSRKGFHNATIQEISEKSEFAVGSIYHMFRNKDEIYLALLERRLQEYLSVIEEETNACRDPVERIKTLIETKFRYFSENKPLVRLFLETTIGSGWDLPLKGVEKLRSRYEEHLRKVAGLFDECIKKKLFNGEDPIGMALALEGMIRTFVTYWIRHEEANVPLPKFSTVSDILFEGILNTNSCCRAMPAALRGSLSSGTSGRPGRPLITSG